MAPNSRIILTRHAQAEHNVDLDYSIRDAPLTALGREQATALAPQVASLAPEVDLVVTSPLRRTLETTLLGWGAAVERLGRGAVVCLPAAQECNALPCDTGSARATLEADPAFAGLDFGRCTPDWTSKEGFWAAEPTALAGRARWVRRFLRDRPETTIVLVAHGDVLRQITADARGPSRDYWRNAEARLFRFDPASPEEESFLLPDGTVAVAGGHAPTATEMESLHVRE